MAALTYLQLCNKLIEKSGISGGNLTSITGQIGESARVISWINEAYLKIQEMHEDWLWMQSDFSFPTAIGKSSYTPSEAGINNFASWVPDTFRCRLTSGGFPVEQWLTVMDYPRFRDWYQFGSQRSVTQQPHVCAIGPDKSLLLGSTPDGKGYTVEGKYYRGPVDLVNDGDIPQLPSRFHMLIVYEAMKSYGFYDAASEVIGEANRQYAPMLQRLMTDQLPEFELAGPLV